MTYNLRSSSPKRYVPPSVIDGKNNESKPRKRKYEGSTVEPNKARLAPDGTRKKNPDLKKSQEEVEKSSNNPTMEQERALGSLKAFLLETFIAEWSIKDLNHLDKLVEESDLLEHMPGQLNVFYSYAFKKRTELETLQIPLKNNKEKLEKYVDTLVDEHHFERFFKMSTFDLEDWSLGELPWVVSKLLWLRFTDFEKNEDHRNFAEARMSNKRAAVPISQLRHHEEPERIPWNIIVEMEALCRKLPRYRPEDSTAKPIEKAYEKLRAVVEGQDPDVYYTRKIRCAGSRSSGRRCTKLVDKTQKYCSHHTSQSNAYEMELYFGEAKRGRMRMASGIERGRIIKRM